ncbi:MAG: hypothetical protein MJ192_01010 [Clostridia bacterium]|nr:hypothetical protein [Clostridia bacterium]
MNPILSNLLEYLIIFSPIVTVLAWFVIALVRFLKVPKDDPRRKSRRAWLIAASIVCGCVAVVYVSIMILLAIAIRNM